MTLAIGPIGMAAWFGLLLTGLNLMPMGQLDGGHVVYSLFRRRSVIVYRIGIALSAALIYFAPSWIIWTVLMLVLGRRHPTTQNDHVPIGRARMVIGFVGLVVFVVSFVHNPIVGSWPMVTEAFRHLTSR